MPVFTQSKMRLRHEAAFFYFSIFQYFPQNVTFSL